MSDTTDDMDVGFDANDYERHIKYVTRGKHKMAKSKQKSADKKETLLLSGDAYWLNTQAPNKLSGKYQFDLSNLDENTVKLLESKGMSVRKDKEGQGSFVTAKCHFKDKDTDEALSPKIVDSQNELLPNKLLVGNGSKVRVKGQVFEYKNRATGKPGTAFSLMAVQVVELVHYESNTGFEKVTGYTVKNTKAFDDDQTETSNESDEAWED